MLNIKLVRDNPELVSEALKKRGEDTSAVDKILDIENRRRDLLKDVEEMRQKRNTISQQIGRLKKEGQDASGVLAEAKKISDNMASSEESLRDLETQVRDILLLIPNIPDESVPVGKDETENVEKRVWGDIRQFDFEPKNHWDIGEDLDILDFERAGKIAGARFVINKGGGARLERALINFMLDLHTGEHGYTEILPPVLVNRETMTGTGQLPKFEDDLFKLDDSDAKGYLLIPTAEVPVTNIYRAV